MLPNQGEGKELMNVGVTSDRIIDLNVRCVIVTSPLIFTIEI